MIEHIMNQEIILAIILRSNFRSEGIEFFTPGDFSQQLGYMKRPKNYVVDPHVHNKVSRHVTVTQEVLFIKSGRIRVDFYSQEKIYLESRELTKGDIVLLASGGHGLKVIEDAEIIEVKQGPYAGDDDKVRFQPMSDDSAITGVS